MRFSIQKKELVDKLQHLVGIVPSKTTMPILSNYLLEVDDATSTLRITVTDMDITVVALLDLVVTESGKAAVLAKNFNEVINALPDEMVHFEKDDQIMKIRCRESKFDLYCAEHDQYPIVPRPDMSKAKKINARVFSKMVECTHFSVSIDPNRPAFSGLFWQVAPDYQYMAATDGKRIAEFRITDATEVEEVVDRIIPLKGCLFLKKIINDNEAAILVSLEPTRVMFQYQRYTIFSSVIDGKFPDVTKAIPENNPNVLIVNKDDLRDVIRRVSLLSSEDTFRIKMDIDDTSLAFSAANRDEGEARDVVHGYEYNGQPLSIAFNYKYLLTVLSVIETERVMLTMSNTIGAVMIYNVDLKSNYQTRFLMMPLRVM